MKSKLLYSAVLFSILFLNFSYSQTYLPDDVFEQYLIDQGYDTVLDNYVSTANIASISLLDLNGTNVTDLTGLEDFTALTILDVSSTLIVNLDVNANTALTTLDANDTSITSLDLSTNTNLNILYVDNTYLNSLDLASNSALTILDISDSSILSIDLSNNVALTSLSLANTSIINIDISNNTALTFLTIYNTLLSSLDLSNNTSLETLKAANTANLFCIAVGDATAANSGTGQYFQWQKDDDCGYSEVCNLTYVPDDNFEQYLITQGYDTVLDNYVPTANIKNRPTVDISNIAVADLTGIEDFTALNFLDVSNTSLSVLHVSNNTSLTYLNVSNISISSLDVSFNDVLTDLTVLNTSNLDCITVANETAALAGTGIYTNWLKDEGIGYSENCNFIVLSDSDFNTSEAYVGPNPIKDELNVILNDISVLTTVSIYDISGKLVLKSNNTTIPVSHIKPGMYLVQVSSEMGSFMRKLIKQ